MIINLKFGPSPLPKSLQMEKFKTIDIFFYHINPIFH